MGIRNISGLKFSACGTHSEGDFRRYIGGRTTVSGCAVTNHDITRIPVTCNRVCGSYTSAAKLFWVSSWRRGFQRVKHRGQLQEINPTHTNHSSITPFSPQTLTFLLPHAIRPYEPASSKPRPDTTPPPVELARHPTPHPTRRNHEQATFVPADSGAQILQACVWRRAVIKRIQQRHLLRPVDPPAARPLPGLPHYRELSLCRRHPRCEIKSRRPLGGYWLVCRGRRKAGIQLQPARPQPPTGFVVIAGGFRTFARQCYQAERRYG